MDVNSVLSKTSSVNILMMRECMGRCIKLRCYNSESGLGDGEVPCAFAPLATISEPPSANRDKIKGGSEEPRISTSPPRYNVWSQVRVLSSSSRAKKITIVQIMVGALMVD